MWVVIDSNCEEQVEACNNKYLPPHSFLVGFFAPNGTFCWNEAFTDETVAYKFVHWLNGGPDPIWDRYED